MSHIQEPQKLRFLIFDVWIHFTWYIGLCLRPYVSSHCIVCLQVTHTSTAWQCASFGGRRWFAIGNQARRLQGAASAEHRARSMERASVASSCGPRKVIRRRSDLQTATLSLRDPAWQIILQESYSISMSNQPNKTSWLIEVSLFRNPDSRTPENQV